MDLTKINFIIATLLFLISIISNVNAEIKTHSNNKTQNNEISIYKIKVDSLLTLIDETNLKYKALSDSLNRSTVLLKKLKNYPFLEIAKEKEAFFHNLEKNRKEYAQWLIGLILTVFGFLIALNFWKVDKKVKSLTKLESEILLLRDDLESNKNRVNKSIDNLDEIKNKVNYESLKSEMKFYSDQSNVSDGNYSVLMAFYSLKLFFELSNNSLFNKEGNLDKHIFKAYLGIILKKIKANNKDIEKKFVDAFLGNYFKYSQKNECTDVLENIYDFLLSSISNSQKDKNKS